MDAIRVVESIGCRAGQPARLGISSSQCAKTRPIEIQNEIGNLFSRWNLPDRPNPHLLRSVGDRSVASIAASWRSESLARISRHMDTKSLFPITGNPSLPQRKRSTTSARAAPPAPRYGEFPCIFPAKQGFPSKDEFPSDSPHRHPGSGCRDFPLGSEDGSGKAREFAGCWRLRSFDTEPETGLFRGDSSRLARLSLWVISVVRFGCPIDDRTSACCTSAKLFGPALLLSMESQILKRQRPGRGPG